MNEEDLKLLNRRVSKLESLCSDIKRILDRINPLPSDNSRTIQSAYMKKTEEEFNKVHEQIKNRSLNKL